MFLGCHDSMVDLRCDEKNCAFDEQIHMKIIPCSIFSWPNQVKSQLNHFGGTLPVIL
jgi:hypothetical protein